MGEVAEVLRYARVLNQPCTEIRIRQYPCAQEKPWAASLISEGQVSGPPIAEGRGEDPAGAYSELLLELRRKIDALAAGHERDAADLRAALNGGGGR